MWPLLDSYKYLCFLVISTMRPICGTALKRILPNKDRHTRFEVLRAENVKNAFYDVVTDLPTFQSGTFSYSEHGSSRFLRKVSVHHTTCHLI